MGSFLRRLFHREGRGDAAPVSIDQVAPSAPGADALVDEAPEFVAPVRGTGMSSVCG